MVPNYLEHSPADISAQVLIDQGVAGNPEVGSSSWPVYVGKEPAVPDESITVYNSEGIDSGRTFDGELQSLYGIQFRIRAGSETEAWLRADRIRKTLAEEVYSQVVHIGESSYLVDCFCRIGYVIKVGTEVPSSTRMIFTLNAVVSILQLAE